MESSDKEPGGGTLLQVVRQIKVRTSNKHEIKNAFFRTEHENNLISYQKTKKK